MIRADFKQATCYIVSKLPGMAPIEIVSERDHRRKYWEEQMEVEHFKGLLDSLQIDTNTILQNLEQSGFTNIEQPTTR